jgi:hypothetical protein
VFDNLAGGHVALLAVLLLVDVLALVQVWRDRRRSGRAAAGPATGCTH